LVQATLFKAEQKGVAKGCHSAYLYTCGAQSFEFYENFGHDPFVRLESFCGEHTKLI